MATYGYTFTSGDTVTPTKLNNARTVSDIVNADIKSDAAIAHSKLANIPSGQLLLGNGSNVPTATAVTGDVTISNAGVTAITAGSIVNADINASAAIAGTKISPAFGAQDITVSTANRLITNTDNFALGFGTNNTERMRIDASGNVGIGVVPTRKLDVVVDAAPAAAQSSKTGLLIRNNNSTGDGNNPNTVAIQFAHDPNNPTTFIETTTYGANYLRAGFGGIENALLTTAFARIGPGDSRKHFSVDYSADPVVKIGLPDWYDVGVLSFVNGSGGERMRIDASGNVGIGTTTPGSLLHLNKSSGAADIRLSSGGTLYGTMFASSSDTTINSITSIPLVFGTNNTERMRIDGGGNVGIGKTNPATILDVNGTVTATAFSGPLTGNVTGNVTGDLTGTASAIADSTVSNAKVASNAAIDGTKISPDFGSQNAVTTGNMTAAKLVPTGNVATGNGMYLPATNTLAFSTDGTERLRIRDDGRINIASRTTDPASAQSGDIFFASGHSTKSGLYAYFSTTPNLTSWRRLVTENSNGVVYVDSEVDILSASGKVNIDGNKVVGARITGWGAPTGTATRTTFATSSVTLPELAERVHALIDDLTSHGLIGA